MDNSKKRKYAKNQVIYVIDCWGTADGMQAFVEKATIVDVDEEKEKFVAVLYGDTYQRYRFKDYGRLFFTDSVVAHDTLRKIPEPKTVVYQIIGNRIYKKKALRIGYDSFEGYIKLYIELDKGKDVPIEEAGVSVFLNEEDARNALKSATKLNLSS